MNGPPRVLVADDDAELLEAVGEAIESWGAEVVRATNGAELLEQLAGEQFSLVVTDISMPGMSGFHAVHSAMRAGIHPAVVIMTGLDDPRIAEVVATLGPVTLLRKPFDIAELESAAREVFAASGYSSAG